MTRIAINGLGRIGRAALRRVKVMAWYDNEWGYAAQMVRQAVALAG